MNSIQEINKMLQVKNEKMGLADFNGHFWVELDDGTIYDDYCWDDKDEFRKYFGIKKNNILEYDKCQNFMTHKLVMCMLDRNLTQGGLLLEDAKRLLGENWITTKLMCMFNATANQYKLGGKVVFGCVYMNSDCGNKRRYICGGENFLTFNDFKKEHNYLAK
jgi:hypothetical protein